jgi:hypothetical protein
MTRPAAAGYNYHRMIILISNPAKLVLSLQNNLDFHFVRNILFAN